jgi:hypothetical protein
MRAFRICGRWLFLVPLLGLFGCGSSAYLKKGPEVKTSTVTIKNCTATPDTVQIPEGDTLTWINDPSDTHAYSISFPKHKPVPSPSVPTGQGQTITGDFWCNHLGGISSSLCLYPYNLIQDGSKTCPDPGVHIVPTP